jgi:hypothetical protein
MFKSYSNMSDINITYIINEKEFLFSYSGEVESGKDEVLLDKDYNLIHQLPWENEGFTIVDFLTETEHAELRAVVKNMMKELILSNGGVIDENFEMANYHRYVDDQIHLRIAYAIKGGWKKEDFPFDLNIVNKRMSEILGQPVSTKAKDEIINDFYIRIVRPGCHLDNNPPHRDVWLDRLRNAVNIYFPLCGSTIDSSLPLLPGSHKYKESELIRTKEGAKLNGTQYTVPCVVSINNQTLQMIRPNPTEKQVLVFTPYMVHGGGYNSNKDETRVSLEMRFWKLEN